MRDGGLTPALSVVDAIKHATSLPLRVMVRENAGFETSEAEIEVMRAAAWNFTKLGVDGLVVGFAKSGELSLAEFERVIEAAPGVPITFHRAFDTLDRSTRGHRRLSAIRRIDAILTSGGEGSAHERCARLREYVARARSRLTIIAGGGVDHESFRLSGNGRRGPMDSCRPRRTRRDRRRRSRLRRERATATGPCEGVWLLVSGRPQRIASLRISP